MYLMHKHVPYALKMVRKFHLFLENERWSELETKRHEIIRTMMTGEELVEYHGNYNSAFQSRLSVYERHYSARYDILMRNENMKINKQSSKKVVMQEIKMMVELKPNLSLLLLC